MRVKLCLSAMVAALVIGAPALANDETKNPEGEKMVCKSIADTVSRISRKKICKTRAGWDQARNESLNSATARTQR